MKNYIYLLFSFLVLNSFSQTVFWNENFGTGCDKGQYAHGINASGLGTWSVVSVGINDQYANKWFISAAEAGMGVGNCGDGCVNNSNLTNRTLHIGYDLASFNFIDDGAAYFAGNGFSDSDIRAQSPTINCSGQNTITLSFLYLLGGIQGSDFFEVQYSTNGGISWSVAATPPATSNSGCSPQGLWTSYSVTLPASCDNNPNVKIGFRWQNIDNTGADPSVAIDDIQLSTNTIASFAPTFTVVSPICSSVTQTLTANTGTFAVSGYSWTIVPAGASTTGTNNASTQVTFPSSSNIYTVTLTATSGTTTASYTQTIQVKPSPIVFASSNPAPGCPGGQFTLTASGASTYSWNPGGLTGNPVVVTATVPGVYIAYGTATNGCSGTGSTAISMNNAPFVNASSSSSIICSGSSVTLSATGAANYTWSPGNQTGSSIVTSPTINTTYTVTGGVVGTPCTGTKTVAVSVSPCTGIMNAYLNNGSFHLYPNPVSDKLNISSASPGEVSIELADALGKIILKQTHNFKNDEKKEINVRDLSPGIYLVKITSASTSGLIRFIKE
jgi:hypothetical protein